MSDITPFSFEAHDVRVVMLDGQPWFVVMDVCEILGIVDARRAASRIEEDDRRQTPLRHNGQVAPVQTWVVNESGLYELIFASNKPEARRFRRWVTSEVLPEIRKTGSYSQQSLSPAEFLLHQAQMMVAQERRMAAVEAEQSAQRRDLESFKDETRRGLDTVMENHDRTSAIGYANLRKIRSDAEFLRRLGVRAAAIARRDGIEVSRVRSAVWGEVNVWPMEVWDEAYRHLTGLDPS